MEKIYIFGHKKPDTDSVAASIALSYLKNQLGSNTVPRILGNPNNETKYALDYFKVETPKYLNDVKLQVRNLNYLKNYYMDKKKTIYEGLNYMNEYVIGTLPIVDGDKFLGIVSMKNIAKLQIESDNNVLDTNYENILKTLDGESLFRYDDDIKGDILIASYKSQTFIENIELNSNIILITGDRYNIIDYALKNKVKMIILTGNAKLDDKHIKLAEKNKVNIIRTSYNTFKTAKKVELSNYLSTLLLSDDVVVFNQNDDVDDVIRVIGNRKFTNYPIINKNNNCLGILRASDVNDKKPKKVILVDHNEKDQSVEGLEEAEIIEIVDHHKIGTIGTSNPINFRNMPVGSSNTIIYMLYKENNIEIPSHIAGLMLSGIISDTLLFKSPTTTEFDKIAVKELSSLANVDYEKYGMEMLKAGASLKGKTKDEILFMDFKNFTIDGKKVGIGQVVTLNIEEIDSEKKEYIELINKEAQNNEYYVIALFATDIIKNGSYIYYNDTAKEILDNSFGVNITQGTYLDNIVSRKKQIIPNIISAIEKK